MNDYEVDKTGRLYAAAGYITWIGFIVAYVRSDKEDKFIRLHLNQSLVLNLFQTLLCVISLAVSFVLPYILSEMINIILGVIEIVLIIGWIIGWAGALKGTMNEAPIFGNIHFIR